MRLVHGNSAARYFPSRHNFALFRLAAYLRLRRAKPERTDTIYFIDRHQSAFETNAVTSWIVLTLTCYLAAWLFADWPVPLAIAAALPAALVGIEIPAVLSGLVIAPIWAAVARSRNSRIAANSFVVMLLMTGLSVYWLLQRSWVRVVAWQFLGLVALNGVAALIASMLRRSIDQLEEDAGGATFAE